MKKLISTVLALGMAPLFLQKVLQKKRFCITIKECYRFRAVV